jgi:peptidoglycan/LPS O-acetylase OafA/YrhL
LPAALVVTIAIVVFSWFVNNTSRFAVIASDAVWSTLFSANLNFAFKSTDYFQIGAAPSPFQHFWSLSVEEQFYFLWPALILMALSLRALKFRGKMLSWQTRLSALFWVTTIASLVFMIVTFYFQPSLSYFLTASRAWELSAGALAAIAIRSDHSSLRFLQAKFVQYLPIPLLAISLFAVRADNFGFTMPLVIIAALILVSKPADSSDLDAKLLSSKALMFVGNISYSLYLWHWPVITFGTELGFAESILGKVGLGALAFGLATLSYYLVELKFQRIQLPKFYSDNSVPLSKPTWIGSSSALLVLTLVLPSVAAQPSVQNVVAGFFDRPAVQPLPTLTPEPTQPEGNNPSDWLKRRQEQIRTSNERLSKNGKLSSEQISELNRVADGASYGNGGEGWIGQDGAYQLGSPDAKTKILVLGSSFAAMYMATFSALSGSGESIFVQIFTSGGCPNTLSEEILRKISPKKMYGPCLKIHEQVVEHVSRNKGVYDYVVLSDQRWAGATYIKSAVEYANIVKAAGLKTLILSQPPTHENLITCLNREYSNYSSCLNTRKSSIVDFQVASQAKIAFGDVSDLFCLEAFCPIVIGDAPTSVLGHLTDVSAVSIAPYFLDFLKDANIHE